MQPPPVISASPEETRKAYLNHEASIQAIGSLYLLSAVIALIAGIASFFQDEHTSALVGAVLVVLGLCQGWVGGKLRKLDPVAKGPATLLACLGLLAIPLGTIINAYFLYLLHSAKGKVVFSPEYRSVIAATPHIRYRMSIVVWILIGIVVLVLLLAIAGLVINGLAPRHAQGN